MIANFDGVPLFPLINYIRSVHGLSEYEAAAEHPVANIGLWSRQFHKRGGRIGGEEGTKIECCDLVWSTNYVYMHLNL